MTKPLLTDARIVELLMERKDVSAADFARLTRQGKSKAHGAFSETQVDLTGALGNKYRIICQRHARNALQFAVQILYVDSDENEYRLIRVAGRPTSSHTNELERRAGQPHSQVPRGFRVNRLTERYQLSAYEEDGFAESANDRCSDFDTAIQLLGTLATFIWPIQAPRLL